MMQCYTLEVFHNFAVRCNISYNVDKSEACTTQREKNSQILEESFQLPIM